ncbi:MAG: hypothetical protein Ct9H300mP28_24140 [Pseudomonadota bacterium]|nr:MAG: hypothetical protein Ct9H300mP28_24140 [Pseudomonadota bacterium]
MPNQNFPPLNTSKGAFSNDRALHGSAKYNIRVMRCLGQLHWQVNNIWISLGLPMKRGETFWAGADETNGTNEIPTGFIFCFGRSSLLREHPYDGGPH